MENHEEAKYLFFYVGGCLYAIEAFKTLGVCEILPPADLAGAAPHMIGITILDNFIWPVVDLQIWLCNKETNRNGKGKFSTIAVEDGKHRFLAVIDAVLGTADICASMLIPVDKFTKAGCIRAYIQTGDAIAGLLSTEGLFGSAPF